MADWSKYAVKQEAPSTAAPLSKYSQYAVKAAPAGTPPNVEVTPEEPGWFQPGSKSEALLRGTTQGASLGFADELASAIRALSPVQINANEKGNPTIGWNSEFGDYNKIRDDARAADANAATKNPGSYFTGEVAGSLPQYALGGAAITKALPNAGRFARGVATGSSIGAGSGLGNSEADWQTSEGAKKALIDTTKGGAIGAAAGAIPAASVIPKGAGAASQFIGQKVVGTGLGGAIGAGTAIAEGKDAGEVLKRLGLGAAGGFGGAQVLKKTIPKVANKVAGVMASNVGAAGSMSLAEAINSWSNADARKVVAEGNREIEAEVAKGKPTYAAIYTQLNRPEFNAAVSKVSSGTEKDEDDEEDDEE